MENGNRMFRPTGSVIQLMDGRIFKRNQKNLWEDINTGVTITENQLSLMVTSASFSTTASGGGGKTNKPVKFVPDYTATQQEWGDLLGAAFGVEVLNANQTISGINAPIEIRLLFSQVPPSGTAIYNATSSLKAYKNDVLIDTISTNTRPTKGGGDGAGLYTLSQTFSNNDTLKFGATTTAEVNYTVLVQNKTDNGNTLSSSTISVQIAELGGE